MHSTPACVTLKNSRITRNHDSCEMLYVRSGMAQKPGNTVSMYSHPPLYADMSAVPRGKASVVEWATGGIRETQRHEIHHCCIGRPLHPSCRYFFVTQVFSTGRTRLHTYIHTSLLISLCKYSSFIHCWMRPFRSPTYDVITESQQPAVWATH